VLTQNQEKYNQVQEAAERLYRQSPDWVTFFREILGVEGTVRQTFANLDELTEFEQSEQYDQIQKMLVKLREQRISVDAEVEPTRVITVRLPKSMHESLRTEAHDLRTSMNKLCISKLLQVVAEELIPNDRSEATATPPKSNSHPQPTLASGTAANSKPAGPSPGGASPSTGTSQIGLAPYGQPRTQSPPATPPFKPTQPRF
jgi:predicted HicB family RNase H-like nuclease